MFRGCDCDLRSGWSALCVRLGPDRFWVEERDCCGGCGARGFGGGLILEVEVEGAGGGIIDPLFRACGCVLFLSFGTSLVSMSMLSDEDGFLEGRERSILVSLMCSLVGGEESVLGRGCR